MITVPVPLLPTACDPEASRTVAVCAPALLAENVIRKATFADASPSVSTLSS